MTCPHCGHPADSYDCGRDDRHDCYTDPTPQHQWELTTPKEVHQ